jgi:hypothetical protein
MKYILLLTLAAASLFASDATGKWTGSFTTSDSDEQHTALLILKQDGAKLTGTAGPDAGEQHEIENGKAENGTITFDIPTESSVMKFVLKQEGDEIKGDMSREHDGQKQTAKLSVKREKQL